MRYLFLIIAAITFLHSSAQEKLITLEDIWQKGTFRVKSVPGFNAMKNGLHFTQTDREKDKIQINAYDLASGNKIKTIFDNTISKINNQSIDFEDYTFSDNNQKILLLAEGANIYRRSFLYKTYLYDLVSGKLSLVDDEKILHPSFSPDGSKIAYVKNNNIFIKDLSTNQVDTVTKDGKKNEIINGNCDWVYEEEFEFTKAFDWAPDGKHLAFYRFDERQVPEYTMTVYDSLYPRPTKFKYPKAGEPNSIIQIKIYNVAAKTFVNADLGKEVDLYIPRIKWTKNPNQLCVYRLNRHQNHLELLFANAENGSTSVIYEENNKYYIEINDNIQFLPDQNSLILNSEQSGFNHFYKWNWVKKQLTPLTKGNYDIDNLIGIDENKKLLYYTAAEKSPMDRQLFVVDFDGKKKQCLTPQNGTHAITAISGYQFFLDKYSTLQDPPIFNLLDNKGKILRTLEDNKALKDKMKEYNLGNIQFKQFPGADGKTMLNSWMMTPPKFDTTKKYPVLMYQYSGPGSQQVLNRFPAGDFFWHQMLAQKGYIVVCVDPTGTGSRGEEFKKATYQQLGNLESNDHIAVAKYLSDLPYVNKSRIGIWGWSFGGFMSSTCLLKGNDIFKAAIAVAPVTNWRYYDNIYTERYMRTPQENPKGYDDNAPEKMASKLKGRYLIIHGTSDDNVHFQNQVMMIDALIKANKDFDSEYYPNKAHGISGGNTRLQLYRKMTNFIMINL